MPAADAVLHAHASPDGNARSRPGGGHDSGALVAEHQWSVCTGERVGLGRDDDRPTEVLVGVSAADAAAADGDGDPSGRRLGRSGPFLDADVEPVVEDGGQHATYDKCPMSRTIGADLVLDARAPHGEGPVWHPTEHTLDWVDIMAGHLHRYDPRSDRDSMIDVGQPIGAFAPRRSGGYVLALEEGFGVLEPSGEIRVVASIERSVPPQRMNDGKCDSAGRFWAGTMAYDFTPGVAVLYRLDGDFKLTTTLSHVTLSNGLDWTDDDRTMYYIDSLAHGIDAFDFDPAAGAIGRRRRLIDIPSDPTGPAGETVPDGMTVDAEGFLWVAVFGSSEVRRYSPHGDLDCIVRLPVCAPTSCAFGGEDLTDLYITTNVVFEDGREPLARGLFRSRPGVRGRRARLFAG